MKKFNYPIAEYTSLHLPSPRSARGPSQLTQPDQQNAWRPQRSCPSKATLDDSAHLLPPSTTILCVSSLAYPILLFLLLGLLRPSSDILPSFFRPLVCLSIVLFIDIDTGKPGSAREIGETARKGSGGEEWKTRVGKMIGGVFMPSFTAGLWQCGRRVGVGNKWYSFHISTWWCLRLPFVPPLLFLYCY